MNNPAQITIVGFGNSITAASTRMPDESKRWLNVLQRSLSEMFPDKKFNVVNAGVGGNSAREAMQRLDRDVLAHNPDFIHSFPLVDFDKVLRERMAHAPKNHYTLDDGVHLTEAGNAVLEELVCGALIPLMNTAR